MDKERFYTITRTPDDYQEAARRANANAEVKGGKAGFIVVLTHKEGEKFPVKITGGNGSSEATMVPVREGCSRIEIFDTENPQAGAGPVLAQIKQMRKEQVKNSFSPKS